MRRWQRPWGFYRLELGTFFREGITAIFTLCYSYHGQLILVAKSSLSRQITTRHLIVICHARTDLCRVFSSQSPLEAIHYASLLRERTGDV